MKFNLQARVMAEFLGTGFLVAAVVGSGIMGERLAGGNVAIALLANTIATGAALARSDSHFWIDLRCPFQSCGDNGRCLGTRASLAGSTGLHSCSVFWVELLGAVVAHLMFGLR